MAEFNLKMIKVFFLVVIAMLVLAMTSGMNILRNDEIFSWQKMKMEADFIKYKRALAAENINSGSENQTEGKIYAKSIPVLLYHGVITGPNWKKDDTNISLADFKEEMFSLKKEGYQTVALADFFDFIKNGKNLPEKSFLLTFDDGRKDSYSPVDPILRVLGYKAVMFAITSQSIDQKSENRDNFYLNLADLKGMEKSGRWEIESHGKFDHDWVKISEDGQEGHFLSNKIWLSSEKRVESGDEAEKRIVNDLASSKEIIEKNLDQKVLGFAYPFNDYGQDSQNFPDSQQIIEKNIGKIYPLAFVQVANDDVVGNYPNSRTAAIKRIDVNASLAPDDLLKILEQNRDKDLPWRDTFLNNQGWVSRWGSFKVWGDLSVGDEENGKSGNLTVLLGAQNWKDYDFKADIKVESGNSISEVVRYQDEDNFVSCNFSEAGVSITEKIDGQEKVLNESDVSQGISSGGEFAVEAIANGNQISCFLGGEKKIEAQSSGQFDKGGIGFSVWDDLPDPSLFFIKKIEVDPLQQ